ncbi:Transcriptional regulator, y4mF family, partial [Dysosmobacter welbionis]
GDGGRLRDFEPRGQALEDRWLSLQAESREDGLSSRLFGVFPVEISNGPCYNECSEINREGGAAMQRPLADE